MKLDRIGLTPKQRLRWVVGLCGHVRWQEGHDDEGGRYVLAREYTAADWANLRDEMLLFIGMSRYRGDLLDGKLISDGTPHQGWKAFLTEVLGHFKDVIDLAIVHTPPSAPRREIVPVWDGKARRFRETEKFIVQGYPARIHARLYDLVMRYGHLLKRCAAPAKRKPGRKPKGSRPEKNSAPCGNVFLGTKETELYCSSKSRGRVTQQAKLAKRSHRKKRVPIDPHYGKGSLADRVQRRIDKQRMARAVKE